MQNTPITCPRTGRSESIRGTTVLLTFFLSLFYLSGIQAQNLVPNGSFETSITCPTQNSFNGNLADWYNPNTASPDYFNPCGVASTIPGGPSQLFGYQLPRTGSSLAGLGWYNLGGGFYDYIQNRFSQPLQAGVTYKVSFWVSFANGVGFASDAIGAYISDTSFKATATAAPSFITNVVPCTPVGFGVFTQYTPQIRPKPGQFISDTANWVEVSGLYTAHGGEQAITIGCFEPWVTTGKKLVAASGGRAYYFIDDVSVTAVSRVANDMTISSLSGLSALCAGTQNISVEVENYGSNLVSSFILNWEVNGILQPAASFSQPIDTFRSAAGHKAVLALGSITAQSRTPLNIKVWASYPNGIIDGNLSNDTLSLKKLMPGISGTFTVGGTSPDYASISDAMRDIDTLGICGPVVFNIRSGTYSGALMLGDVPGASQANTITFQSEDSHKDSVIITHAVSSATDGVIRISSASFVTFRKLTIRQTLFNASSVFVLEGYSDHVTIDSCSIHTYANVSGSYAVYSNTPGTSNLLISNNTITGGYNSVHIAALADVPAPSNKVIANHITNSGQSAIYFNYPSDAQIARNQIEITQPIATAFSAIWINQSRDSMELSFNKIVSASNYSGTLYGLRLENVNFTGIVRRSRIVNNSIALHSTGTVYGIYASSFMYIDLAFNSVNIYSTTGTSYAGYFYHTPASGAVIRNNIFSNTSPLGAAVYHYDPLYVSTDYNQYFSKNGSLIYKANAPSTTYTSLKKFCTVHQQDSHSVAVNPHFVSFTNLNINAGCNKGAAWPGVTTDLNGTTRAVQPAMGAYEYAGTDNIAVEEILTPAKGNVVPGNQELRVLVKNRGDNMVSSFVISYQLGAAPAVVKNWTGTLAPCDTAIVVFNGADALNVNTNALANLVVYTQLPNNNPDTHAANDSVAVEIGVPMHGAYTIAAQLGDFSSFTEAITGMNKRGISDTVYFDVQAASTYTEAPFLISEILGNQSFPIIFRKAGAGINPVIYGKYGTGSQDAVVTLKGTNRVTFDGIDIKDSAVAGDFIAGMEYGYRIINLDATSGANGNVIRNARITLNAANINSIGIIQSTSTLAGAAPPTGLSGANHYNRYENVTINNCYNGILLNGDAAYADSNCRITADPGTFNLISGIGGGSSQVYGIQAANQKNVEVSRSVVTSLFTTSTQVYGIYLNNLSSSATFGRAVIKSNKVSSLVTTSTSTSPSAGPVGLMIELNAQATALVANNVVHSLSKANSSSGNTNAVIRGIMHCYSGTGVADYLNNTVSVSSGSSLNASSAAFWKGGGAGTVNLLNNVLLNLTGNQTGSARHVATLVSGNTPVASSANVLWSGNTNGYVGAFNGSLYATLGDWKNATSQENMSTQFLPALDAANDLYPVLHDSTVWLLNGRGSHAGIAQVPEDMEGVLRPQTVANGVPDIGAYEFTPLALPFAATAIPDSIAPYPFSDTTQIFVLAGDTIAKVTWKAGTFISRLAVRQYSGERPVGISASQNHMFFYTDIEPSFLTSYSYDLSLAYRDNWLGTNPVESDLRLAKKDPSSLWQLINSSSVHTAANTLHAQSLIAFGQFSGTDLNNPMPVTLVALKAEKEGADAQITWTTASEQNNKGFEIQRSFDGKEFTAIGFAKGKGNSSSVSLYRYSDGGVFERPVPVVYYRLKQLDNNGKATLSHTVTLTHVMAREPKLYPNPFSSFVSLEVYSDKLTSGSVEIYDVAGKRVLEQVVSLTKGQNTIALERLNTLTPGVYFATIRIDEEKQVIKLIKE